jgi:hypothetical protein
VNLKHKGVFPDPQQWSRVGERVYEYVSAWCSKYLKVKFDALDQSVLLNDEEAKLHYDKAKKHFASQEYKEVMEEVGWMLRVTFDKKPALSGISIGKSSAEDAIRLAAFGVQANDFIRLQQFLPGITRSQSGELTKFIWNQDDYGHPGNWHEEAARFCLNTALDIAIKLQTAAWIPGPVPFHALYEYKVEAIKDDVQIWNLPEDQEYTFRLSGDIVNRKWIKTLSKGETVRAIIVQAEKKERGLAGLKKENRKREELSFIGFDYAVSGWVAKDDVKITCVPRNTEMRESGFPDLPEIEWWPPS